MRNKDNMGMPLVPQGEFMEIFGRTARISTRKYERTSGFIEVCYALEIVKIAIIDLVNTIQSFFMIVSQSKSYSS